MERCESEGAIFTDAGDRINIRCSFVGSYEKASVPRRLIKHPHSALIFFARDGEPVELMWGDDE